MLKILNEYIEDGYKITEYTIDGETVSHTMKAQVTLNEPTEPIIEETPQPILEDKVNYLYYKQMGVI